MKPRIRLSTKIFLICFLNVLLIGLVLLSFLRIQLRVGINSFFASPVQERLLAVTREAALELQGFDAAVWDGILARFGQQYRLQFYLLDANGKQLAGSRNPLPRRVSAQGVELIQVQSRERMKQLEMLERMKQARRDGSPEPELPHGLASQQTGEMHGHAFQQVSDNPTRYWVGTPVPIPGPGESGGVLIAGTSSWKSSILLFDFRPWLTMSAAIVLVSVLCWLPFIHGVTKSISSMTRATARIAEGQFDVQLPTRRRDELGQLGHSINRMAARLAHLVQGQKRFLGDVAHELCSPLARIQLALGILDRSADVDQHCLADLQEDAQYMSTLVHEVLSFSRASLKPACIQLEPVSVATTIGRLVERESSSGTKITTSIAADGELWVRAEPELLSRALGNLVRNAIRYAGDAGPIEISAQQQDDEVVIRVADSGPGLPEKELEAVFEPFYRLETARDRESGGVGLGLAIVKTCIESCQGSVRCRNRQPSGLEVEIRLAAAQTPTATVPQKQVISEE